MRSVATTIGLLLATATQTAISADVPQQAGQYFCYQKGEAVQFDRRIGYRPTSIPEDDRKFVITINPIKRSPDDIAHCKTAANIYLDDLTKGREYRDHYYADRGLSMMPPRNRIGWECFTKDELLIKYSDVTIIYRSYDLQFDFVNASTSDSFLFYADESFEHTALYRQGKIFVYGQCEKIIAPK